MAETAKKIQIRKARESDIPAIRHIMDLAIRELQKAYLSSSQIEASFQSMGLDSQLIEDGTYFCALAQKAIIGCGGWSFRATRYGGNHSAGRDTRKLDPNSEPARIRAMYTHPDHTRRGIGRQILRASENAARADGFKTMEMVATLAGERLYSNCGYQVESRWFDKTGLVDVPVLTMVKTL